MRNKIITVFVALVSFLLGLFARQTISQSSTSDLLQKSNVKKEEVLDLSRYTIENLSKTKIEPGKLSVKEILREEENFNEYSFEFEFKPDPLKGETKKTTGQINIPKTGSSTLRASRPLIIMLRGYINKDTFKTGDGTRSVARYFAKNGFITVAPDFLGYGGSDKEAANIFESRFQTYTTVLSLLKTLESLTFQPNLVSAPSESRLLLTANNLQLFLWAHSNGGQIALTVLEVTAANYPTVLWAPVSKAFPYSVLFYTDQSVDRGKLIRKELAKFEENHDVEKYSLTNYLDRISAPLQIQQGEADDAVPVDWTNELVGRLVELEKDVTYYKYPETDHNMRPSWNIAVERDLEFLQKYLP